MVYVKFIIGVYQTFNFVIRWQARNESSDDPNQNYDITNFNKMCNLLKHKKYQSRLKQNNVICLVMQSTS